MTIKNKDKHDAKSKKKKKKNDQNCLRHVAWEHWKELPKGAIKANLINLLDDWLDKSNNFKKLNYKCY